MELETMEFMEGKWKNLMLLFYIYTHIIKIWKLDVGNKIMLY